MRAQMMIGVGAVLLVVIAGQADVRKTGVSAARPGELSADLIEYLESELASDEASVQLRAIRRLEVAGPGAAKAAEALSRLLADKATVRVRDNTCRGCHEVRIADAAAWALHRIGPPALPCVKKVLKASKGGVRQRAARVLGAINEPMDDLWAWAIADADSNVEVRILAARP